MRESFVFLLALTLVLSACTVRAREAQDLTSGEVAAISFSRSSPEIDIVSASLDGQALPTVAGTSEVRPGARQLKVFYQLRVADGCDAFDRLCPTTSLKGVCEGDIELQVGNESVVALDTRSGELRGYIRAPWSLPWENRSNTESVRLKCSTVERSESSSR